MISLLTRMVTGAQIRAARALIGWSANKLAQRSGLSYPTIQRAESVNGIPRLQAPNLAAIQRALEDAGVVFLDNRELREGGPGVRLAFGAKPPVG
jgi:transcriptional regulator with XRE-family HTH domain